VAGWLGCFTPSVASWAGPATGQPSMSSADPVENAAAFLRDVPGQLGVKMKYHLSSLRVIIIMIRELWIG
jgi:hypothetical protein